MPRNLIFKFAEKTIGTGDELRLTITFRIPDSGADIEVQAEDNGIYISDYGTGLWEHDVEEFLLTPGEWSPKISDVNDNMARYLVGRSSGELSTEKNALVHLEIKYLGESTWQTEFKGRIDPQSVEYNFDKTYLTFTAVPSTDILNSTFIHDPGNPAIHYNPLGYDINAIHHITKIIEDIYKLVSPSISYSGGSLVISQDWLFKGLSADPPDWDPVLWIENIPFSGIRHTVRPLFFDENYPYQNVGDLLKKFAADFGCFTGMEHQDKAFFKKVFSYQESDVYDLDEDSYYGFYQRIMFKKIEYVVYTLRASGSTSLFDFTAGAQTPNEDKILRRSGTTWIHVGGVPPLAEFDYVWHHNGVRDYAINGVLDPAVGGTYQPNGDVLAPLWLNIRGEMKNCMADEIETPGLRHSITKNPRFKGSVYHITKLRKHYAEGYSTIEGIPISV